MNTVVASLIALGVLILSHQSQAMGSLLSGEYHPECVQEAVKSALGVDDVTIEKNTPLTATLTAVVTSGNLILFVPRVLSPEP